MVAGYHSSWKTIGGPPASRASCATTAARLPPAESPATASRSGRRRVRRRARRPTGSPPRRRRPRRGTDARAPAGSRPTPRARPRRPRARGRRRRRCRGRRPPSRRRGRTSPPATRSRRRPPGGQYSRIGIGPAGPSIVRSSTRSSWCNRPAGQVAEPLPRRLGTSLGRQLERHRFQYLLQDGIQGGLVAGVGDGHRLTVRIAARRGRCGSRPRSSAPATGSSSSSRRCDCRRVRSSPASSACSPRVKALTAVLLAAAALGHPIPRERRWLVAALVFSAAGDFLLAMPWWAAVVRARPRRLPRRASVLPGRAAPAGRAHDAATGRRPRSWSLACVRAAGVVLAAADRRGHGHAGDPLHGGARRDGVRGAAGRLPTPWTALGAVCFAVSDGMIGIGKFVLRIRGAGRADLVGVRRVAAVDHRRILLRPRATAVGRSATPPA